MSPFEKCFHKHLRENNTVASAGFAQSEGAPEVTQFSADTYAKGDARMVPHFSSNTKSVFDGHSSSAKKKKEKKPVMIRRTAPETIFLNGTL